MVPFRVEPFLFVGLVALVCIDAVWSNCDSLVHLDETCGLGVQYFGNRALKPSSNRQQFDDNCRTYENGVNCITDYTNKCLAERPATMGRAMLRSVKDHYVKRCKDKEFGNEFIEHSKCFDDPAIFEQFHQCADKWHHKMQQLNKNSLDIEKSIQAGCCIFHDFQRCIREQNTKLCHDKNVLFWDDAIDEVSDETIQIFCAQLKTAEECDKNFPKELWDSINSPVAAMDAGALQARDKFKSMFVNLLDLISQWALKA